MASKGNEPLFQALRSGRRAGAYAAEFKRRADGVDPAVDPLVQAAAGAYRFHSRSRVVGLDDIVAWCRGYCEYFHPENIAASMGVSESDSTDDRTYARLLARMPDLPLVAELYAAAKQLESLATEVLRVVGPAIKHPSREGGRPDTMRPERSFAYTLSWLWRGVPERGRLTEGLLALAARSQGIKLDTEDGQDCLDFWKRQLSDARGVSPKSPEATFIRFLRGRFGDTASDVARALLGGGLDTLVTEWGEGRAAATLGVTIEDIMGSMSPEQAESFVQTILASVPADSRAAYVEAIERAVRGAPDGASRSESGG